jgi:GntR family transcriptional regulator, arabinose operon transcriptional repressor
MDNRLDRRPNASPLHTQLTDILRERILQGVWRNGESLPPEKTLCTEFDVARGTIRQALQNLEVEGFLRREQGRGTFVRFDRQNVGSNHIKHVGFMVPYVRDSSVSTILIGFQEVAEQAGYSVIFHHVNNDLNQQTQALRKLVRDGVKGIALYPVDSDHDAPISDVLQSGLPVVLIDRYLKHFSTDFVMTDHFGGAMRGTTHLIDQGHTRIGFVTWLSPAISMEHRYLGYMQAVRERGIEPDPKWVCYVEGYPTVDISPLKKYLSQPDRPTAIFAANDQIAIALYRAANAVGLSIPQDLSIVGFDNLDISPHVDPPLTTIAQPFLQIGRTSAEILLRRIEGQVTVNQQVTISPQLLIRESTAALDGVQSVSSVSKMSSEMR